MKVFVFLTIALMSGVFCQASPRQEARFLKPIRDLQHSLGKKNLDLVVDSLIEKANRTDLFELEALLRVYESEYPETLEGFLKEDIKPFEDELGKLLDIKEGLRFAEEVEAPKEVISYLKGKQEAQRESFKRFLRDHKFVGEKSSKSPLIELQDALSETDWSGKKSDRKHVLKSFRGLFKEISKSDYDMKVLEEGLHEFRRDLRWIPIYLRSFPDLFKLDGRELPEAKISSEDPIFKSPYSKLPPSKEKVSLPILFPKLGLMGLNKAVDQLGRAKDIGKMEELLTQALKGSGVSLTVTQAKTRAKELVRKQPKYVPVVKTAQSIYRAMKDEEEGLIEVLKPLLKEQKSWKKRDCKKFLSELGQK